MDLHQLLQAGFLGIVEGITEFLPVSSTGHLILADELIGFESPGGKFFEVVIQLGAILAICVLYWKKLWHIAFTLHASKESRNIAIAIILAFLPAAVLGAIFHDAIKQYLFTPIVVSISLVAGGFVILAAERVNQLSERKTLERDRVRGNMDARRFCATPASPIKGEGEGVYSGDQRARVKGLENISFGAAIKIGLFQCIAMIPGVSRSGATIIGALLVGVERETAAEFSFFLAIPTMLGATALDLFKNREYLTDGNIALTAAGFISAFISALVVVKWFVRFIGTHDFSAFAWYRIAVGTGMLLWFQNV